MSSRTTDAREGCNDRGANDDWEPRDGGHSAASRVPSVLDAAQLARFFDEGYLILPNVLSASEVRQASDALDRLQGQAGELSGTTVHAGTQFVLEPYQRAGRSEAVRIHRIVWCEGAEPILGEIGRSRRMLSLASQLLDSTAMDHLINQAHFKLPGDGVHFSWHQDCLHRRYGTELWDDVNGRGSFVEIIVAIDPMTEENGPIRVIPGSCRAGAMPVDPATRTLLPGSFNEEEALTATLEPGDALLIGPYTVHGSKPNESGQSRRLFLNGFASPGANKRVYPGCGTGRRVSVG